MSGFFDVPGGALSLARRVLYCWVRTSVFPEDLQEIGLDPAKSVCYVLQHPHLSDLLVLMRETSRNGLPAAETPIDVGGQFFPHSFFFLQRRHSFNATARERYAPPALMSALTHAALHDGGFDVQIVPVVILWGRAPDKQESILKALFSENWKIPTPLRRMFTILMHGRNVLVRFSAPISLHGFSREGLDEAWALRKLSRILRVHFLRQREIAIGPDLSHRNTQVETLLDTPSVRLAIATESETKNISLEDAQKRARRFALEIASDYTYGVMRALELLLAWLWTRLYDGFEVHNIDTLTRIAPGQEIIYVPVHRSHIDYLLLSCLLHSKGFTPPHIAAGANLNMPLVGPLLRRCGAFFLRRSFKGEALYAAIFHEYLHLMLVRGFPLEYFIEGGRSRSGRTLNPKAGILGMTIRSFIRERPRPLYFVPVYIGYEKLIEGHTYQRELAGKPKQRESLWGILASLGRIRKVFGKVHVNFGNPLSLDDFLERRQPGWKTRPTETAVDWQREVTGEAACELAKRLNAAAVITPINLVALALLPTPRHTADAQTLERLLAHYQALSVEAPYSPEEIPCSLAPTGIIAYAERLGFIEKIDHPLGPLIRISGNMAPLLAYFRNNVLHLFILPALIACLLSHNRKLGKEHMEEAISGIYSLLSMELFLHWSAEELPGATGAVIDVLLRRKLLCIDPGGTLSAPGQNSQEFAELQLLGETLRPMLERHFLILALLQHFGSGKRMRATLENDCHLLAQRLAKLYVIETPEYSEKAAFSALIAHLIDTGFLEEDASGLLHFDTRITEPLACAELVLPPEARQSIRRLTLAGLVS